MEDGVAVAQEERHTVGGAAPGHDVAGPAIREEMRSADRDVSLPA